MTEPGTPEPIVRGAAPASPAQPRAAAAPPAASDSAAREAQARLEEHRRLVEERLAAASDELDRLRMRQAEAARGKAGLEADAESQRRYEERRRELAQRLRGGIAVLRKREAANTQLGELIATARGRFDEALAQITGFREADWPESEFGDRVKQSLALMDELQTEYERLMARIDALSPRLGPLDARGALPERGAAAPAAPRPGFGYWLMVGFAVSVPLALVLLLVFALALVAVHWF